MLGSRASSITKMKRKHKKVMTHPANFMLFFTLRSWDASIINCMNKNRTFVRNETAVLHNDLIRQFDCKVLTFILILLFYCYYLLHYCFNQLPTLCLHRWFHKWFVNEDSVNSPTYLIFGNAVFYTLVLPAKIRYSPLGLFRPHSPTSRSPSPFSFLSPSTFPFFVLLPLLSFPNLPFIQPFSPTLSPTHFIPPPWNFPTSSLLYPLPFLLHSSIFL